MGCHYVYMRKMKSYQVHLAPDEVIGHFGPVKLVCTGDGMHELIGGTLEQRTMVRNWCERNASFVVFATKETEILALAA